MRYEMYEAVIKVANGLADFGRSWGEARRPILTAMTAVATGFVVAIAALLRWRNDWPGEL